MPTPGSPAVRLNGDVSALVVEQLTVRNTDVVREAQRWTTGERGPLLEDRDQLVQADLTNYVTEAVRIGSLALSVTGQAQESRALEQMLKDVGDKTADSTAKATEATARVVQLASETVAKAAGDASKAITDADIKSRKELTDAVDGAKNALNAEVSRIFGGDSPELLDRLRPMLDKFSADLDTKVSASTHELLTKAAKQFDPTDPTSPMSKHTAELAARQELLTQQLNTNHAQLTDKVDELTTALKIQEAKVTLAKVTPIKGGSFEGQIHTLLRDVAGGLGDEYVDTTGTIGHLPACKKGDGVLTVDGGAARVVVEMTDSRRTAWTSYFADAERNRGAAASLGLVRTTAQNGGQSVRVIGTRRVVMAFDPGNDDPELLRTVVMLLRTAAITATSRKGGLQIATATEKIGEALEQLAKIDAVKKLADSIVKSAAKVDTECTSLSSGIRRMLDQALAALGGVEQDEVSVEELRDGAA